jgi:hypothetical protein
VVTELTINQIPVTFPPGPYVSRQREVSAYEYRPADQKSSIVICSTLNINVDKARGWEHGASLPGVIFTFFIAFSPAVSETASIRVNIHYLSGIDTEFLLPLNKGA